MFGYATDETEECMPLTVVLAHKLIASIRALERSGTWPWVRPDGKTQVCIRHINCKGEKQQKSFTLSATLLEFMFVKNGAVVLMFQRHVSCKRYICI